ncbi:methyltransferase [Microbacterium sp. LWH11-1.2]|uniref:methyltransferase n=1 Tax=Microbacterium sp. LWH11-1.2 TaxID=3135258 RepID=UPI0031392110
MAKLSKQEAKNHEEAERILRKPKLDDDDRMFVIENWQEGATQINGLTGAFFTPWGLATDAMLELGGWQFEGAVLDLCAGMGTLSLAALEMSRASRVVCVELNPEYARVGRKMVPDAEWVVGSIFDHSSWGDFDHAISNPPFGKIKRAANAPRYRGSEFEYHVIDIAAHHAGFGTHIIPNSSAGFDLSNDTGYRRTEAQKYRTFVKQTGITLEAGCGVDTRVYADRWHGVSPAVEIACVEVDQVTDDSLF